MLIAVTVNSYNKSVEGNEHGESLPTHFLFRNAISLQSCKNAVELLVGFPAKDADVEVIPIDKINGKLVEPKISTEIEFDFLKD